MHALPCPRGFPVSHPAPRAACYRPPAVSRTSSLAARTLRRTRTRRAQNSKTSYLVPCPEGEGRNPRTVAAAAVPHARARPHYSNATHPNSASARLRSVSSWACACSRAGSGCCPRMSDLRAGSPPPEPAAQRCSPLATAHVSRIRLRLVSSPVQWPLYPVSVAQSPTANLQSSILNLPPS